MSSKDITTIDESVLGIVLAEKRTNIVQIGKNLKKEDGALLIPSLKRLFFNKKITMKGDCQDHKPVRFNSLKSAYWQRLEPWCADIVPYSSEKTELQII